MSETGGPDTLPISVSRETIERLKVYEALVLKWTKAINLISRSTENQFWTRHIIDSVQVFDFAAPTEGHWVDLGSGGGMPGAVVAILAMDLAPNLKVTCVESDERKATFLRTVSRETSARFSVVCDRIENLPKQNCAFLSARALAPLTTLLKYSDHHLAQNGVGMFPKGASYAEEVREAEKDWQFRHTRITSWTDPNAAVIKIGDVTRA